MRTDAIERDATFAAPVAAAHALLSDPRRLVEIHPLIAGVTVQSDTEDAGARVVSFTLDERVPIGPFRLRNPLRCEARWTGFGDLVLTAWSRPGVIVRSRWRLDPAGETTHAVQRVEVEAPWWVAGFVFRTARTAHAAVLERVQRRLEA